ncbi:MAG: hypothetical protein WC378_11825 [Opitutaceae bacterium]
MISERESLIQQKILQALAECGDYLLLDAHLVDAVSLKVPQMRKGEFDDALRYLDSHGRVRSIRSERGEKWGITDAGRMALQNNE